MESVIGDGVSEAYFVPKIKRRICNGTERQTYAQTHTCDKFHEKSYEIVEESNEISECVVRHTIDTNHTRNNRLELFKFFIHHKLCVISA